MEQGLIFLLQRYYGYYRRAIRDALTRFSRKPFKCGGLRGYDQLKGICQHLGAREDSDPYLDELRERVRAALESTESQAEDVRQAWIFLTEVEHYLASVPRPKLEPDPKESDPPPGSEAVCQKLTKMFNAWEKREDVGATIQRLLGKWDTMSQTWLPGILHCYDIAGLPRHNLQLEGTFGALRRHQRRVSGRKETTPLRVFGPGKIVVQVLDEGEILPWLQSVSPEEYWAQRRKQEEREEPRRWLGRLRRNPEQAMTQVDEQFYKVVKELSGRERSPP
ncbi:MAG: hypothetical protein V3S14_05575 [Anaerolineae bacterium]